MPNHVTTILRVTNPQVLAALVRTLTPEDQLEAHKADLESWPEAFRDKMPKKTLGDFEKRKIVDFEQIIPSPPNKEKGGCFGTHEDGIVCWYSWNVDNWGTKWGAYDAQIDEDNLETLQFETAWSHPYPVIETLSRMFPDEPIKVQYADEDLGSNLAEYVMLDGKIIEDTTPEDPAGCLDFAAMVKHGTTYAMLEAEWEDHEVTA